MSLGPNMSLGPSSPEFDKFLMIIVHPENLDKMDQFIDYTHDEWLPKANLWSQDGNNRPRTTNTAEAFHNRLRTHSFSHLHPELIDSSTRFSWSTTHSAAVSRNWKTTSWKQMEDGRAELEIWKDKCIMNERTYLNQYINWAASIGVPIDHSIVLDFCTKCSQSLCAKHIVDDN